MPILLENHQIEQNAVPQKTVPSEVNVPSKANDDKQKSKNNIPYQMIIGQLSLCHTFGVLAQM